jgi:hypothetical protein
LRVDPFIEGGTYTVAVGLLDPASDVRPGRPIAIGQVEVQAVERVFDIPKVETGSGATFGEVLQLLGYDLLQTDDHIAVTLHWQAQQRMGVAYKFFVHLYDTESKTVVTQADVMPYDWTYPTTWWEAGEFISDRIVLSLANVPQGVYRLHVGVYKPHGERLTVSTGGDYLILNDKITIP